MDETIDILISCSSVPLSVIIVGVGNEDFEKMEILDCDDGLKNTGKAYRDLVQFVKLNNETCKQIMTSKYIILN